MRKPLPRDSETVARAGMVPGDDSESSPSEDDTALRTVALGLALRATRASFRQRRVETLRNVG